MIDYIVKTKLLSPTSLRPIHDHCLGTEAKIVGQALYVLYRQSAQILELKTDSVLYRPLKRAKKILENVEYKDLSCIRNLFDPVKQRRLDQYTQIAVNPSCETVYRVQVAEEKDMMRMNPKGPKGNTSTCTRTSHGKISPKKRQKQKCSEEKAS